MKKIYNDLYIKYNKIYIKTNNFYEIKKIYIFKLLSINLNKLFIDIIMIK